MENSEKDGNTRPTYLPREKTICRTRSKLELDVEQQTGLKLWKEYVKAVYHQPAYLTYMQSTSHTCQGGWQAGNKISGKNINNLRYADDITLMVDSKEERNSFLMKVKEESEKLA